MITVLIISGCSIIIPIKGNGMARTVKLSVYGEAEKKPKDLLRQKGVYKKDDMREYRRLCRELSKLLFSGKAKDRHRGFHGFRSALSSQQQCIVKCRIGKETAAHQRFIKEYLPQENKSRVTEKPELFNTETVGNDYLEQYAQAITGRHFKFIISPESPRVDIPALVKTLVKRMEKITGYSFYWMAAVHADTDHPHAHLLLNGADRNGKTVDFDHIFITQPMREMNRQICTELIGRRSSEEIRASLSQSHKSYRYCHIDESIRLYETALKQKDEIYETQVTARDDLMQNRLAFLSSLGLAKKAEDKKKLFYLERDWQKKLKAAGRYNSFLKARSELSLSLPYQMELYTRETGEASGKITRLYRMNDEENWNHAILIENDKLKKAWYVPLYFEPDKKLLNAEVVCGLKANQKGLLVPNISVKQWNTQDIR
jgi:hypothetical protein